MTRGVFKAEPAHAHPLVRRLFAEMKRQRVSVRELAARTGMTDQTIYYWRTAKAPSVPNIEAAFNALGFDLVVASRQSLR